MSVPSVSVVVPTRERPAALARCLAALAELDHPPERLEVVVVDDGGRGAPAGLPGAAAARLRIRRLGQARGGPGSARNAGAVVAEGDVLAFTDDDCRPDRDWLRAGTEALASAPGSAVGGRTLNALTHNPFAAASQHVQDLVYGHYNADPRDARFIASNNLLVGRAAFASLGGFDARRFPAASEDRDFCDRWRAGGGRIAYAHEAVVLHEHEMGLLGFCRQHVAYGRGAARFHATRRARGTGRLRDELPFHTDPAVWRAAVDRGAPGRTALLALWQVCNALGYADERLRPRRG